MKIKGKSVFVKYASPQEKVSAFKKMIAAREEWEKHIAKIMPKKDLQTSQL